ncbi:unnamed protein product [Spirodela intermedia]|uniref:Uncharacterized protein n=1 Tax=Spirodela intermedia TaxID=51605 RepID=A0A7I8IUP7_SPIIN|nr:unnamed protein product [Spirodela intermedia]CAA6661330.1 unnamed protein product [Spirodela intermedia]
MLLLSCAYCVPLNNNTCIFPIFRLWVLCIHLRRIPVFLKEGMKQRKKTQEDIGEE